MSAFPLPFPYIPGETPVEDQEFQDRVQQNFDALALAMGGFNNSPRQCRAYNTASQALTTGTLTAIGFNAERWDNGVMHDLSTNNTRVTAPTAGIYSISGNAVIAAAAGGSTRRLALRVNGTAYIAYTIGPFNAADNTFMNVSTTYQLAATDYVELIGFQDSGGNLNVLAVGNYSPELSLVRLGGM